MEQGMKEGPEEEEKKYKGSENKVNGKKRVEC